MTARPGGTGTAWTPAAKCQARATLQDPCSINSDACTTTYTHLPCLFPYLPPTSAHELFRAFNRLMTFWQSPQQPQQLLWNMLPVERDRYTLLRTVPWCEVVHNTKTNTCEQTLDLKLLEVGTLCMITSTAAGYNTYSKTWRHLCALSAYCTSRARLVYSHTRINDTAAITCTQCCAVCTAHAIPRGPANMASRIHTCWQRPSTKVTQTNNLVTQVSRSHTWQSRFCLPTGGREK